MLQGLLGGAGGPSGECGARLTRLAAPLASAAPAQSGPAPRGSAGCGGTAAATSTPCRRGNCDDASARSTRSTCRWSLSGAYPAPSPVPPRARPPERPGAASGTTRPAPPACMKTMTQACSPPFCGTQLVEICGVDRPRYEGDRGAPRLSAPYNYAQLGPPGLEGITPPRRRGAPGGKTSQSEAYSAQLRTFILHLL